MNASMNTEKKAEQSGNGRIQSSSSDQTAHEEVAVCSYLIWEHEGCKDGHDVEDWLQAERQLQAMRSQESAQFGTEAQI